jgi:hypothetical protein
MLSRRKFLQLVSLGPLGILLLAAKPAPKPRRTQVTFQTTAFTAAFQ